MIPRLLALEAVVDLARFTWGRVRSGAEPCSLGNDDPRWEWLDLASTRGPADLLARSDSPEGQRVRPLPWDFLVAAARNGIELST